MSAARFRDHCSWLGDHGWRTLTLVELLEGHRSGSWPNRSIVLTFDDGFSSVVEHAVPILQRAGFSALLFVAAGHLGATGASVDAPPATASRQLLDAAGLRDAHAAGLEIGSHALTHVRLTAVPPAIARREIVESRAILEDAIGAPVRTFAYPFGVVSPALADLVRDTYDAGFTTHLAHVTRASDRALFERIDGFYLRDSPGLSAIATGRGRAWLALRRWGRALRT